MSRARGASSSASGFQEASWKVGFIVETEPGAAPSALRFDNLSSGIITGVIGETTFWQVLPMTLADWQIGRSVAVQNDALIGYCDTPDPNAPCAFLPVVIGGVGSLLPGQSYVFAVSDDEDTFAGEIIDDTDPAPVFTGLRTHLAMPLPPLSKVEIEVSGVAEPVVFTPSFDATSAYAAVELDAATVVRIGVSSTSGEAWEATPDVNLQGAFGYTLHVGKFPPDGALGVEELVQIK